MLPRKISQRKYVIVFAVMFTGAFIGQPPVQGYVRIPPKVTIQKFISTPKLATKIGPKFSFQILHKVGVRKFSLVGVTWLGDLSSGTEIQAKVHDKSGWSKWQSLSYSPDHGPDARTVEAKSARRGTDPLITAESDGIEVRAIGNSAIIPKNLEVSLIDSVQTPQDAQTFQSAKSSVGISQRVGSTLIKSGALVSRPNIVTRAEWGADESWRDPSPRISSKIIAGFIHHTATTNSYNPEDGPAQMRSLYAYFTKSLKYADMGYNFLVDRYGVVYEGRAGCTLSATECDGPSRAVIGAHTAGMNDNTFAISAIGNFQIGSINDATAQLMMKAISGLMAWKIAPYNLDPSAMASIPSTDTSGLSKYRNGTTATVPVISGHRDVGRTVCPGKYLYSFIPKIRDQIAGLLVIRLQNVSVLPLQQLAQDPSPISMTAEVPISSSWNMAVVDAQSGSVVYVQSGIQQGNPNFSLEWDHTDASGHLVPAGNYAVSLSATVADKQLPTETTMVTLGKIPARMSGVKIKRVSAQVAVVSWPVQSVSVPLVDTISYRTSTTKGSSWTMWKLLPSTATELTIGSNLKKRKILIEIKQSNSMGESTSVQKSFVTSP